MNNIIELKIAEKIYTSKNQIYKILKEYKLYWLIDSEVKDAKIKIYKDTVIWNEGTFISGNWHYGIFKNGEFYGKWLNGIFVNGTFKGTWESGINLKK